MPITILGMPRAGISLIGEMLRSHGVAIASAATEINAAILARHDGEWDAPPIFPAGWETSAVVASFRPAAEAMIDRFRGREPWGWADQATTFTLPFWRTIISDLVPLVVIRNPAEVMLSLHARTGCSLPCAIDLVRRYLDAIRQTTTPESRVVTHYGAYAKDAAAEADRVLRALGWPTALADCGTSLPEQDAMAIDPGNPRRFLRSTKWKKAMDGFFHGQLGADRDPQEFIPSLRHARFSLEHLPEFAVPADIIEVYRSLCAEAGFSDDDGERDALDDLAVTIRDLRGEVASLRRDLAARDDTLEELLEDLRFMQTHLPVPPKQLFYRQMIRRIRDLVRQHVPKHAVVAVISKGDDELLRHRDREGWHFPQDERGTYAGWYPACDLAAIAHLETLRSRGATHLLVPEAYAWWLSTYAGFRRHLDDRSELLAAQSGAGTLYALASKTRVAPDGLSPSAACERLAAGLGRPAQVLDLVGDGRVGDSFPGAAVFQPPAAGGSSGPHAWLPYIDASIDVVAVASPTPEWLAEARRVASFAVIDCGAAPQVEWLREPPAERLPAVSIVMPVFNQWPMTRGCLEALWGTVPPECEIEVIVIDDASTDDTPHGLASMALEEPRLKLLRSETNSGFVASCNRGAAAATGEILVFLNNDTVPLPGWLPSLVRAFGLFPRVGAVGGKLLFPDGRLQEAGGILFADASACHFGRGEANAMAPLFNHVRQVDYVSGALLATPRELFASLGGFDPDFAPGYYEDTDYCFRLRERGYGVFYQPEAAIVHLEGATAGTDPSSGMKRHQEINRIRFRARHAAALQEQRRRPDHIGADSWAELAHRGKGRSDA